MSPVSVVTTLRNERDSLDPLIDGLLSQTRLPDEIVVVDAGSTDGTAERLDALASRHPALTVLHRPSGRSQGRNIAIEAARGEVIACIDGGCVPEPDWLERLVTPFDDSEVSWVAGFYRPVGPTVRTTCIGLVMVYVLDEVVPGEFLPSARSMAFRKDAWKEVGGFPEDLDFAEDTLFDEGLVAAGHRPLFAGDAVVRWTPPSGYLELARTMYRWGRGDGLAGLRGHTYKRLLLLYGGTAGAVLGALLLRRARLVPLALAPLVAAVWRQTRCKFSATPEPSRYMHIPLAEVVARKASMIGFLAGYLARRGSGRASGV